MKPRLRDYLAILAALLVIFLCGGGIGYLLGEKKGRSEGHSVPTSASPPSGDWSGRTMGRLDESLDLTESQRPQVRAEVESTAQKITTSRNQAVAEYYRHLLQLHDDLLPHLEPEQQKKIAKAREKLQLQLESAF